MTPTGPGEVPGFLPGLAVAAVVTGIAAPWLGHHLLIRRAHAAVIILSLGAIAAATLTPLHGWPDFASPPLPCDLSRVGLAPLRHLVGLNDTSLNIVLFAPLGAALALVRRARWRLLASAAALPFLIETVQLVVPPLARGCQSADVIDNLTGLVLGASLGWLARKVAAAIVQRGR